jgi:hypothetical protein
MDSKYAILWEIPDNETTTTVRARMFVGTQIIDETFSIALSLTNETSVDIDTAVQTRIAEIAAGSIDPAQSKVVSADNAEQLIEEVA